MAVITISAIDPNIKHQIIRFLIGIFILQKTRQRFWLSSAIAGQPDVAAAFGLRV